MEEEKMEKSLRSTEKHASKQGFASKAENVVVYIRCPSAQVSSQLWAPPPPMGSIPRCGFWLGIRYYAVATLSPHACSENTFFKNAISRVLFIYKEYHLDREGQLFARGHSPGSSSNKNILANSKQGIGDLEDLLKKIKNQRRKKPQNTVLLENLTNDLVLSCFKIFGERIREKCDYWGVKKLKVDTYI